MSILRWDSGYHPGEMDYYKERGKIKQDTLKNNVRDIEVLLHVSCRCRFSLHLTVGEHAVQLLDYQQTSRNGNYKNDL